METHFVFILFSCGIYSVSLQPTPPTPTDPVDFTVLDDSTILQAQKSSDGLPLDLNVDFDVLGKHVSLKLKRNPKVTSAKDVLVIRKSESGIPVLVPQTIVEKEVFGEFQDVVNGAIFTLSCPVQSDNTTKCNPTMEGTFRTGQGKYLLSPMEENALARVKRNANRLWSRATNIAKSAKSLGKVYGIYVSEQLGGTPTDFKEDEPLIRGNVAAFGRSEKTVRENVLPGGRMYNLEILAVIDYGMYERFYKASREGTEMAKDNDAKYNLKKYFSHVFNGVDMLYQSIDDPDFSISVGVSGFIIADSPNVSPWTTPHIDRNSNGRHDLLVSIPLDELLRWSFSARNIPENDHIMLLTDYNLYSVDGGVKDKRTAGYARVGSVCSLDSVSVIEDHGGFQSINAAAHELGHGLGSRHDGRMNSCDASAQYIMTAHGGFESEATKSNPWTFSTCSVAYFKDYISRLPPRNCLTDPIDIFNKDEYLEYVSTYPGQDYTPNEQCQDILGLDSYYGWGTELGQFNNICTEMSCKVPGPNRSYRVYKAATGTSCGDKKWCIKGRCVFDEKAPTKDPSCLFGDTQRRFGRSEQTCRQYMMANPMRCYNPYYKTRCCDTCEKLNTGVQGCEYGDKFLNCQSRGCFSRSYANDCCSTCGLAPNPVIRLTPTPRPTTTPKPVTWRPPVTTRWPVVVRRTTTTRRPMRVTTTKRPPTRRTTTRRPKPSVITNAPIKPSGSSGLCLRKDARFLLVFKCSSLTSLFGTDACDNSLVSRYCCERCPDKGAKACEDSPSCNVRYARQCYIQTNKDKCCRTCRRFETGQPGCEFGDKIRSCERHIGQMGLAEVCSRYKDYCCGVCSALATNNQANQIETLPKSFGLPEDSGIVRQRLNIPTVETILPGELIPNSGNNVDVVVDNRKNQPGKRGGRKNKNKNKENRNRDKNGGNKKSLAGRSIFHIPPLSTPSSIDQGPQRNSNDVVVHRFIIRRRGHGRRFNRPPNQGFSFIMAG